MVEKIIPKSHKISPKTDIHAVTDFAVDELAMFAQTLIKEGVDPKVFTRSFIDVSATMFDRVGRSGKEIR